MREYSRDPFSNNQVLDTKDEISADPELLKWAGRIFVDPLSVASRIPAELFTAERITPEYETPLYLDWQVRDTELGYQFLDQQRERLLQAIESFGAAIAKKQRSIVSARARLRALQKILFIGSDTSAPNSQPFPQIDSEISAARTAIKELLSYTGQIETLSAMLNRAAMGLCDESYHLTEQRMRLLGQSWRGWLRVHAYQDNFPARQYSSPSTGPAPLLEGLVITHSTDAPSPLGTDLLICPEAAAYLRHYLTAIAALATEMGPYFQPRNRPRLDQSTWPNLMLLLRAIVEFFYFCSFEMPILSNSLMVDARDPNKRMLYNAEKGEWQPAPEEALSNRLKRDSATVAHLILSVASLPDWQTADDVSVPACETAQTAGAEGLRPYCSTGLARLNINQSTQVYKFQPAYKLTGRLIEQLISTDTYLSGIFQSPLGGGLETITGMAALDFRAFKFSGTAEQMPSSERFQWLSHFWKAMGKWRPIALLGDTYTKEVSAGLNSLGEAAPERSSMVSIQLPTLTRAALSRTDDTAVQQDPLTTLTLADQIRLLELLNITWAFADEIAMRISKLEDREALQALIASLPEATSRQEAEITRRFNTKWTTADHPFWNLLRGSAPTVWEFWITLANQTSWVCSRSKLTLEESVNTLLNLCADVIRLILLLESSSPAAAERLNVDSETAGRVGLTAFQRCRSRLKESKELGSPITESLSYYYDSEILYDAWIAFTSSFKTYLRDLQKDLQRLSGSKPESAMFARAIAQLELHYPTPIKIRKVDRKTRGARTRGTGQSTSLESENDSSVRPATLEEKDAERVELLSSSLLDKETIDQSLLMKLLALLQSPEMRESIHSFAEFEKPLRDSFPDPESRRCFFSTPAATRDTAQFLLKLKAQNNGPILSGEPQKQLQGYFNKLLKFQKYVESVLGSSSFSYPEEREELSALASGTSIELVLFSVFDHFFCVLTNKGTNHAVARIEDFLKQKSTDHFSNWKPEYLILGAAGIHKDETGFTITSSDLALDPIFLEPEERASSLLISNYLQGKYGLVANIFKQELSDQKVTVQPR